MIVGMKKKIQNDKVVFSMNYILFFSFYIIALILLSFIYSIDITTDFLYKYVLFEKEKK